MTISPSTKQTIQRFASLGFLFLMIALLGPFFSYLQTAFGWTNPTQNPPGGSGILSAYEGKVGINILSPSTPSTTLTVDGIISAVGNRIVDIATPVAGTDAANKAYVDAQTGGGGSGAIVTLFGTSDSTPAAYQSNGPAGQVPSCIRGATGQSGSCTNVPNAPVVAGNGTPACTSLGEGWAEVIAGYGPLNQIYYWYAPAGNQGWPADTSWPPDVTETPTTAVGLSDSICSTASFAYVGQFSASQATGQWTNSQAIISACTTSECNTCRICIKSN